jgi:hypothetical protein
VLDNRENHSITITDFERIRAGQPAGRLGANSPNAGTEEVVHLSIFHVSGAKQAKTRAAQAEKCVPMILSGRGFNQRTD